MPEVFPTRIISFSSEDKAFPACNLLKKSSFSKWKSEKGGTKQEVVEFDFGQPVEFSRLDVGNNGSAFIEVLVRRSASSEEPTVFLPSASFMSPVEAKNETNLNRVRVFSKDSLSQIAINQKWDIVKFICSQPFNKTLQFGLSFVSFHSHTAANDVQVKSSVTNTVNQMTSKIPTVSVNLLEEDESNDPDLKPGSLFLASKYSSNAKKENEACPSPSVAEKIRAANGSSSPVALFTTAISSITPRSSSSHKSPLTQRPDSAKDSSQGATPQASSSKTKIAEPVQNTSSLTTATSAARRRRTASNHLPLDGLVFSLSGYQNPLRSEIRDMAMRLGASFRQDWSDDCTHLICAFPNTPKFKEVKGRGIIVSDKWITKCHDTNSLVDWRPYRVGRAPSPRQLRSSTSLQTASTSQKSTGDEMNLADEPTSHLSETDASPESQKRKRTVRRCRDSDEEWRMEEDDSGEESEDSGSGEPTEVEEEAGDREPKASGARKKPPSRTVTRKLKKRNHADSASDDDECSKGPEEQDTDDEIQRAIGSKKGRQDHVKSTAPEEESTLDLPDFFEGKHFFIHNKAIPSDEERLLQRLIVAFAGTLHPYMHPEVQFVVTRSSWSSELDEALGANAGLVFVLPDWILACDQEAVCLPYNDFLVSH